MTSLVTIARESRSLSPRNCSAVVAIGASSLVWVLGLSTGVASGTVFPIAGQAHDHQPWHLVWPIFSMNLSVALGLVAGVVTFGLACLAGAFVVGTYTGATWHACWHAIGLSATLERLLPFFAVELAGLFCATVAGLLPVVTMLTARCWDTWAVRERAIGYMGGMRRSLTWVATSVGLLAVAACLEVLQGVPR